MKNIWKKVDSIKADVKTKNKLFMCILVIICSIIGGLVWLIAGRFLLPGPDWLICFIGYPAIFVGFFGGALYLYNHEFV